MIENALRMTASFAFTPSSYFQHQRSRSAGAASSRSEVKVSRLPMPAPPPPSAPFWGSAPLSPSVQVKAPRKKGARSRSSAAARPEAEVETAVGAGKSRRKEKEGSLNFLSAGSDAGRSEKSRRSEEEKERKKSARPVPLSRVGACAGTARKSPERRAASACLPHPVEGFGAVKNVFFCFFFFSWAQLSHRRCGSTLEWTCERRAGRSMRRSGRSRR